MHQLHDDNMPKLSRSLARPRRARSRIITSRCPTSPARRPAPDRELITTWTSRFAFYIFLAFLLIAFISFVHEGGSQTVYGKPLPSAGR